MPKAVKQRPSNNSTAGWTSAQAYALALVCLGIGLLMGWFLRGSEATGSHTQPLAAAPSAPTQPQGPPPLEMVNREAEPLLQELKRNPQDAETLARLGNLYYDSQYYPQAVEYYGKALMINPANVNVRTDMGTAYWYQGDADRAVAEFEKSLKYRPDHPNTLFNLGIVKWQGKRDANGAVAAWEQLLKSNPNYPEKQKVLDLMARAKQQSSVPEFAGKG